MTNPYATPESDLTSAPAADAVPAYGGFWRRLAATLLDGLFLLPLFVLHYFVTGQSRYGMVVFMLPAVVVPLLYHMFFVLRQGATPGKRIMKMRIAMADGSPVTARAAFLRYLPWTIIGVLQNAGLAMAALAMTDETFASYGYFERQERLEMLLPMWAVYGGYLMKAWSLGLVVTLLVNPKRRTLHDFVAGTVVLRTRS